MKLVLSKNLGVFAIYALASLLYFKSLALFVDTNILADYFYTKVIALIVFYLLSVRFSDLAYSLKSNNGSTFLSIKKLYVKFYIVFTLILLILLLVVFNVDKGFVFLALLAYFIYFIDDSIEGAMSSCRLFNDYRTIFIVRAVLLIKPVPLYLLSFTDFELIDVLIQEALFSFILFFCLTIFWASKVWFYSCEAEVKYIIKNLDVVTATWLQGVSKLSYEALPQALLGRIVSPEIFVEYSIARRILGLFANFMKPILQALVAESSKYKANFNKYIKKYMICIIPLCLVLYFVFLFYDGYIIELVAKSDYSVTPVKNLILLSISLFILNLMLSPIKQFLLIKEKFRLLKVSFFMSSLFLSLSAYPIINKFEATGAATIQGVGIFLPLIIALVLYKIEKVKYS